MNPYTNEYGDKYWYDTDGEYHREDGPACEWANGNKEWWKHGTYHREDGPAIERVHGDKFWFKHGKKHREDGPAMEWADGVKYYYLEGIRYSEEEYWKKIKELNKCKLFKLDNKNIGWI